MAVEDAGRGCVTEGLAGYGESSFCPLLSSFVLDMSICLSSGETIYVVPMCPLEVVADR